MLLLEQVIAEDDVALQAEILDCLAFINVPNFDVSLNYLNQMEMLGELNNNTDIRY